jgi:hypothetical protein
MPVFKEAPGFSRGEHVTVAWLGLFRLSMQPHARHSRDVLRGSTKQTGTPARFAL